MRDLTNLKGKKVLIRLHVLGDFFNVNYVKVLEVYVVNVSKRFRFWIYSNKR